MVFCLIFMALTAVLALAENREAEDTYPKLIKSRLSKP